MFDIRIKLACGRSRIITTIDIVGNGIIGDNSIVNFETRAMMYSLILMVPDYFSSVVNDSWCIAFPCKVSLPFPIYERK